MQSNATIIYPACFLFRKWSLIIIISLDLMIIFYTTFALVGRLQMLDFDSNEIKNQNHYPELYNHQILHGTNLIHNDSNLDDNKEWINQTSMLMEKKMKMETATTTTNNPFDLLSSLAFNNIEIPTVKLTTTTMATETDPFKTSNADDNDNQIDNDVNNRYNRYHDDHNEKSYNDNNTNSSISSFEHSIWFEMFEHRIYQRPKVCLNDIFFKKRIIISLLFIDYLIDCSSSDDQYVCLYCLFNRFDWCIERKLFPNNNLCMVWLFFINNKYYYICFNMVTGIIWKNYFKSIVSNIIILVSKRFGLYTFTNYKQYYNCYLKT